MILPDCMTADGEMACEGHSLALNREREKVAAMMLKISIATGHGDTIDELLSTLAIEIVMLQTKLEEARKWAESATRGRREFRAAYGEERPRQSVAADRERADDL